MAEEHPRPTEAGGDQLLEADGRGGVAAWQFGHEGNARFLNPVAEEFGLRWIERERDRGVDRLAVVAGREDRRGSEPLVGEVENGVDIVAGGERSKAVDRRGAKFLRSPLRPVRNLLADATDLEPVGEHPEGRKVSALPLVAQTDNPDPEFHDAVGSSAATSLTNKSRSRLSPLSEMSLRHHAPAQRMALTAV